MGLWVTSLRVVCLAQDNPVVSKLFSDYISIAAVNPAAATDTTRSA
jgi:hypothetical protein